MANSYYTAIAGVKTAIALIQTASGYNYDLGSTEYLGAEAVEQVVGTRPRVYILSVRDEVERFSTTKNFMRMEVTLRGILDGTHYRDSDDILKLKNDMETAMFSDKTLSGSVTTLRYSGGEVNFERFSPHPIVEMTFQLDIHYTEGAP